jgi:putative transcriptional regulator
MAVGIDIVKKALTRLRKRREELGLSQAQIAEVVDVNPSYVGLLERCERVPSLEILIEMCRAVRLTPADLFADANPKPVKDDQALAQVRVLFSRWSPEHRTAAVRVLREIDKVRRR